MGNAANVHVLVPRLPTEASRPQGEPLPELWRRFWLYYAPNHLRSPNSIKNYRRAETLSATLPPYPTPADVVMWLAGLQALGNGPGTVDNRRACLSAVYTFAQRSGWSTSHPVLLAPWKPAAPPEKLAWRGAELHRRYELALRACETNAERLLVGLLRYCALRLEEGLGLERGDVVTRGDPWRVSIVRQRGKPNSMETQPPKGKRGRGKRRIPVTPQLRTLLAPLLAAPPVQLTFGTRALARTVREVPFVVPFRQNDLNRLHDRIAAVMGDLPRGEAWHVWRRSRALELWDAGVPLKDVSTVLGHESETTTERYLGRHAGSDVRADVFTKVDAREENQPCPF
jgi:integrase